MHARPPLTCTLQCRRNASQCCSGACSTCPQNNSSQRHTLPLEMINDWMLRSVTAGAVQLGLQEVTDGALRQAGGAVPAVRGEHLAVSEEVTGVPGCATSLTRSNRSPEIIVLAQESERLTFWVVAAEHLALVHSVDARGHLDDVLTDYLALPWHGAGTGWWPRDTVVTWLRQVGHGGEEGAGEGEELGGLGGPGDGGAGGVLLAQLLATLWCRDTSDDPGYHGGVPGHAGLHAGGQGVSGGEGEALGEEEEEEQEEHPRLLEECPALGRTRLNKLRRDKTWQEGVHTGTPFHSTESVQNPGTSSTASLSLIHI